MYCCCTHHSALVYPRSRLSSCWVCCLRTCLRSNRRCLFLCKIGAFRLCLRFGLLVAGQGCSRSVVCLIDSWRLSSCCCQEGVLSVMGFHFHGCSGCFSSPFWAAKTYVIKKCSRFAHSEFTNTAYSQHLEPRFAASSSNWLQTTISTVSSSILLIFCSSLFFLSSVQHPLDNIH